MKLVAESIDKIKRSEFDSLRINLYLSIVEMQICVKEWQDKRSIGEIQLPAYGRFFSVPVICNLPVIVPERRCTLPKVNGSILARFTFVKSHVRSRPFVPSSLRYFPCKTIWFPLPETFHVNFINIFCLIICTQRNISNKLLTEAEIFDFEIRCERPVFFQILQYNISRKNSTEHAAIALDNLHILWQD